MAGDGGRVPDVSEQRADWVNCSSCGKPIYERPDPERAEIEGLRPFLVGAMREARHVLGSGASDDAAKARALRMLNDALGRLDRVRDARGDDKGRWIEPHDALKYMLGDPMDDERAARSPQGEDREAGIEAAAQALLDHQGGRPAIELARIVVDAYLSRVSQSRDGTVAVEDVAEWLRVRAGRTHGNGASSALYAAARDLRAEFGPARAGESNEGGNQ